MIAPLSSDLISRDCTCKRHSVWWRDSMKGLISVYDEECHVPLAAIQVNASVLYVPPMRPRAWLLGITNALLMFPNEDPTKDDYAAIVASHSDTYLFKTRGSCIVRFRPGHSTDSRWERRLPHE